MSRSPVTPGDVLIGKYRVDRELGAGNMGVVVAATHLGLGHRVAIKFMLPGKGAEVQHQRFLREARAAVRLKTEHVARVIDVGTMDDGAPYMIMEHLDGRDLAAELKARGPLPVDEAVGYVLQAAEAVAEAHAAGIVHRDLKPANLFLTRGADGAPCVKVLDFGISKLADDQVALTGDLEALGSPLYMSPEQMHSSREADARSDIWSMGVTLYELVAGRTPFHGEQIQAVCTRVFLHPPEPLATYRPDAPPGLEALIAQCLEKKRERRFPNLATLAAALVPYGPPHAAMYAERVAGALGECVAPARLTDVLPPEPVAARAALAVTGTGSAVVRSARTLERPKRRRGLVAGAVIVMLAGGTAAAFAVGGHGGATVAPAGSGSASPAVDASLVVPVAVEPDAGPDAAAQSAEPAATAPALTAAPTAAPVSKRRPPTRLQGQPTAAPAVIAAPPVKPPKPKGAAYEE